jgi:hypothetical protein
MKQDAINAASALKAKNPRRSNRDIAKELAAGKIPRKAGTIASWLKAESAAPRK